MAQARPATGSVAWIDLTTGKAPELNTFYQKVVGWKSEPTSMGEYDDFTLLQPETNDPVAGVCNDRGSNTGFPQHWLMYVVVDDLTASLDAVLALRGEVIRSPQPLSGGTFAIIKDPVGAVLALFQP